MGETLEIQVPDAVRPWVRDQDVPRFFKVCQDLGHRNYSKTISHLLDVYESVSEGDKIEETFLLMVQFSKHLKKLNPALYKKLKEEIKNV